MKPALDDQIHQLLEVRLRNLEDHFAADVLSYFGPFEGGESSFMKIIEELIVEPDKKDKI